MNHKLKNKIEQSEFHKSRDIWSLSIGEDEQIYDIFVALTNDKHFLLLKDLINNYDHIIFRNYEIIPKLQLSSNN